MAVTDDCYFDALDQVKDAPVSGVDETHLRAVQNQYMGNENQIKEPTIEVEIGANKRPISVPLDP